MEISGTYTLNAPREQVWEALLDPDMLQRTIPGCEKLEQIGPDEWRMRVTIGIAAVKGTYEGTLRMTDRVAPEHYRLVADGTGARSVLHGDGTLTLEATGATTTVVNYKGEAQINGPLAGIANRVAGSVSRMLVNQFFGRFQKEMDVTSASAPIAVAPEAAGDSDAAPNGASTPSPDPAEDAVFDASTSGVWEMSLPEARPLGDEQMPIAALPLEAAPAATAVAPSAPAAGSPAAPAAAAPAAVPVATVAEPFAPATPIAPEVPAQPSAMAPAATAAATPATVSTASAGASTASAAASATPAASRGGFMGWVARLFGRAS